MMIKCRECGQMKSDSAGRCPHCGASHDYGGYAWGLIIVIAIGGLVLMISQCWN